VDSVFGTAAVHRLWITVEGASRAADEKALATFTAPVLAAAVYPKGKLLKLRHKSLWLIPAGCGLS